jgi:hypothetical protein
VAAEKGQVACPVQAAAVVLPKPRSAGFLPEVATPVVGPQFDLLFECCLPPLMWAVRRAGA